MKTDVIEFEGTRVAGRLVMRTARGLFCAAMALGMPLLAQGQGAGIVGLNAGQLTWTNSNPALEYRVEWASSPTNAWSNRYESVGFITATGTTMTTAVPMFLRIAGSTALSQNVFRASDLPLTIPTTNNSVLSVLWSDSPNGPWFTNWFPQKLASVTGAVMTLQTPRFFRVDFISLTSCASNFANCLTWSDFTGGGSASIVFACCAYNPPCLKTKVGDTVSFSGNFSSHPLSPQCQALTTMEPLNTGTFAQFTFTAPGFYNYQCAFHGGAGGMNGNIWVVP